MYYRDDKKFTTSAAVLLNLGFDLTNADLGM